MKQDHRVKMFNQRTTLQHKGEIKIENRDKNINRYYDQKYKNTKGEKQKDIVQKDPLIECITVYYHRHYLYIFQKYSFLQVSIHFVIAIA